MHVKNWCPFTILSKEPYIYDVHEKTEQKLIWELSHPNVSKIWPPLLFRSYTLTFWYPPPSLGKHQPIIFFISVVFECTFLQKLPTLAFLHFTYTSKQNSLNQSQIKPQSNLMVNSTNGRTFFPQTFVPTKYMWALSSSMRSLQGVVNSPQRSSRSVYSFSIVSGHPASRSFAVSVDCSQIWWINSTIPPKPLQYLKGFPSLKDLYLTYWKFQNLSHSRGKKHKKLQTSKTGFFMFFYFLVTFPAFHWKMKYVFFSVIVSSRGSELSAIPHIVFLILFTKMSTIEFSGNI